MTDATDAENFEQAFDISLDIDAVGRVNFASAQNDVTVLKHLKVSNNDADRAVEDIAVKVTSTPAVFAQKTWKLDRIPPGLDIELRALSLPLDLAKLAGMTEAEKGTLEVEIAVKGVLALINTCQLPKPKLANRTDSLSVIKLAA